MYLIFRWRTLIRGVPLPEFIVPEYGLGESEPVCVTAQFVLVWASGQKRGPSRRSLKALLRPQAHHLGLDKLEERAKLCEARKHGNGKQQ